MTKDEWTRKIILNLASGHTNFTVMKDARNWLAGKEPPIDDDWKPGAVEKFKANK